MGALTLRPFSEGQSAQELPCGKFDGGLMLSKWKRKFIFLSIGQAVSMLSSSILQMAIIWHLTERTGSAAIITLSTLSG